MGRPRKNAEATKTPPWENEKKVEVSINGAEVLAKVKPEISKEIAEKVHDQIMKRVGDMPQVTVAAPPPKMYDPDWQEYIMNQFTESEMDKDGHPKNQGLRNSIMRNLGTIIHSVSKTVFDANEANGWRATANHVLKVAWNNNMNDIRTFGETADVYPGTADPTYARHAAAMAGTRAESRTFRKALNLSVISAEEVTTVPITESGIGKFVHKGQLEVIDTMCAKLEIDQMAYINGVKINGVNTTYDHPKLIPYDIAVEMVEKLGILNRKRDKIPQELKDTDYNPDWLKDAGKA